MPQPRVLIADDDLSLLAMIRDAFRSENWNLDLAKDGQEALDLLLSRPFDVAVLDLKMPRLNGMEVFKGIQEKGLDTDVIFLTGYATVETAVWAMKRGAKDFIKKPFKLKGLGTVVQGLLDARYPPTTTLAGELDAFLGDHSCDPSLSVEALARDFRISSRYVSKLLNEKVGMSYRTRLTYFRVQRAKEMIESTDEPLYVVAEKCGFKSYRILTAAFRRFVGEPPGRYRKKVSPGLPVARLRTSCSAKQGTTRCAAAPVLTHSKGEPEPTVSKAAMFPTTPSSAEPGAIPSFLRTTGVRTR